MDRHRFSARVAWCCAIGMLLAVAVSAYPIAPVPLWSLTEQASLIVVAEVVSVDRIERRDELDWNSKAARLRVIETLKGIDRLEVEVPFPAGLTCPEPPRYFRGQTVVAFLSRWDERWSTVGLSYGTLYPRGEALDDVTTMVREAIRIQRAKMPAERFEPSRHAWQVQAAALPGTRWHGLYELSSWTDEMRYYDDTGRPERIALTDEELTFLANALVEAPRFDRTLPMMLRTLGDHGGEAVDALVLGALEGAMVLDEPPYWATQLLWAVLERRGESKPQDRVRRFGLSSIDVPPAGVVKAIWAEAKAEHAIPDIAPLDVSTVYGARGGERSPD